VVDVIAPYEAFASVVLSEEVQMVGRQRYS